MKKTLLMLSLLISAGSQVSFAQARTIRGQVVNASGSPSIGATVSVKGNSEGAVVITDENGNFEISVPDGFNKLEIVDLGGGDGITIDAGDGSKALTIKTGTNTLDNVTISTGYINTNANDFTGVADVIKGEKFEKTPVSSFTKALEGAAPGLQVSNGGGQPGSDAGIAMRGIGSISASSAPLIVLDGAPYVGNLTSINPQDIANVVLLKDAVATSLYGSRGANGVIVVTTKRGKVGDKPKITIDGKAGTMTRALPNYDVMTSEKEYYETSWKAYRNTLISAGYEPSEAGQIASGLLPALDDGLVDLLGGYNSYDVPGNQLLDPVTGALNPNANLKYHDNWFDELQRVGIRQDYNLAVSNANERTDYYFSLGYMKEEGFVKYSDYERFTTRLNLNTKISDWLSAGVNMSGAYNKQNYFSGSGTAGGFNPFYAALTTAPVYPVYYRNAEGQTEIDPLTGEKKYDWGAANLFPESSIGTRATLPNANVLGSLSMDRDRTNALNITAVPYLEAKFLKHFTFRTNFNVNYFTSYRTNYRNSVYGQFFAQGGSVSKTTQNTLAYTFNQLLTYDRYIANDHHISAVAGHENYKLNSSYLNAGGTGIASAGNTNLAGIATPNTPSSYDDADAMESYFLNAAYDYKGRYFLNGNIRRDGSSRFPERWGNFASIGASWILSKEAFLKDVTWVDALKIKASYGTTGNRPSDYYGYKALYGVTYPNGSFAGALVDQLANNSFTWEKQRQLNVGIEAALFNRINLDVNFFDRGGSDLIYFVPKAPSQGGNIGYNANVMSQTNRGIEVNLNASAVKTRDFRWDINFNITHYKNKITKMFNDPAGNPVDSLITGDSKWKVGVSRYDYYLVESAGVDPANGDELYYYIDEDGQRKTTNEYALATASGRDYKGSSLPTVFGAITNTFTYKGFDFSFLVSYSLGGKYLDDTYQGLMGSSASVGNNFHRDAIDAWTPENTGSSIPRLEYNNVNNGQTSTRFLIDGSYLNIRNINFGYNFGSNLIQKAKLTSLRVYAAADNIYLFSKRKGMNPQATISGGDPGYIYSPARTIMVGLQVGL